MDKNIVGWRFDILHALVLGAKIDAAQFADMISEGLAVAGEDGNLAVTDLGLKVLNKATLETEVKISELMKSLYSKS